MNIEKIRTNLWVTIYTSADGSPETKADYANKAVDAFDKKFDIDEGFEVSVEDILDVLKKTKNN